MLDTDGLQLDQLSVKELQELREQVHTAIRAAIRQRAEEKAKVATPVAKVPAKVDMAAERDAWMAAKRRGTQR